MAGQKLQRIALSTPNAIDLTADGSNGGNYLSNVGRRAVTKAEHEVLLGHRQRSV